MNQPGNSRGPDATATYDLAVKASFRATRVIKLTSSVRSSVHSIIGRERHAVADSLMRFC